MQATAARSTLDARYFPTRWIEWNGVSDRPKHAERYSGTSQPASRQFASRTAGVQARPTVRKFDPGADVAFVTAQDVNRRAVGRCTLACELTAAHADEHHAGMRLNGLDLVLSIAHRDAP